MARNQRYELIHLFRGLINYLYLNVIFFPNLILTISTFTQITFLQNLFGVIIYQKSCAVLFSSLELVFLDSVHSPRLLKGFLFIVKYTWKVKNLFLRIFWASQLQFKHISVKSSWTMALAVYGFLNLFCSIGDKRDHNQF